LAAGRSRTGRKEAVITVAGITVAGLGEFGLIAAIRALLPADGRQLVGPGDDAAVITAPDRRVVATTDLLVEGRHFRRDWSGPFDIGAKAAAQNLADVAAMGAAPTALLVGLAVPGDLAAGWVTELTSGLADECARAGAAVAGGDVSAAEAIVLAITALGDLAGRDPVTRSGARPGDQVAVAGLLGASAAGFALLAAGPAGDQPDELARLVARHRRPEPPYAAGPQAAVAGATSMIDISDGLVQDVGHLAQASGVRIDLRTEPLAASPAVPAAALAAAARRLAAADWLTWALAGGEDHALAATYPADCTVPAGWSVIGSVQPGRGVRVDGRDRADLSGWDHFHS
jgi:thiamine-monophosphate kinase